MSEIDLVFEPCGNCTTFIQDIQYFDSLTDIGFGGMLGIGFILIMGSILFLIGKAYGAERAAPVAMTITSFLAIMLGILGVVQSSVIYLCIILLVISLFILFKGERG